MMPAPVTRTCCTVLSLGFSAGGGLDRPRAWSNKGGSVRKTAMVLGRTGIGYGFRSAAGVHADGIDDRSGDHRDCHRPGGAVDGAAASRAAAGRLSGRADAAGAAVASP